DSWCPGCSPHCGNPERRYRRIRPPRGDHHARQPDDLLPGGERWLPYVPHQAHAGQGRNLGLCLAPAQLHTADVLETPGSGVARNHQLHNVAHASVVALPPRIACFETLWEWTEVSFLQKLSS